MILFSYGTRPEFIKVKPIIDAFELNQIPYRTLFTGQHLDLIKDQEVDYRFTIKRKTKNRLSNILCSAIEQFENLPVEEFTGVLVQGDTTSALAVATAAFNNKIPVIHLEAGLRTYDIFSPFPEEYNRRSIGSLASVHLCPTLKAQKNLKKEGITKNVYVVGNSVLDNLSDLETSNNKKVIVTLHRREKFHEIDKWFAEIEKLATKHGDLTFELPAHPNPDVQKHLHIFKKVKVRKPYDYQEFVSELASCYAIITDSGGIQEEAAFLKKPCVVCREYTERTEGLRTHAILCKRVAHLGSKFNKSLKLPINDIQCPYGDGKTGQKVQKILCDIFNLKEKK